VAAGPVRKEMEREDPKNRVKRRIRKGKENGMAAGPVKERREGEDPEIRVDKSRRAEGVRGRLVEQKDRVQTLSPSHHQSMLILSRLLPLHAEYYKFICLQRASAIVTYLLSFEASEGLLQEARQAPPT
jgi:hypothetical protein